MHRPLLVTADPDVLDDLLRLAATAGVKVDVAPDAGAARRSWSTAPLVVVGPDVLDQVAAVRLPRRPGVVVVAVDLDDAAVWPTAVQVGAERVVFLPDGEAALVDALADAGESRGADGLVVAVLGGRGGAGATTLAAALALTAARSDRRVLLVDGDPLGGGIDLVFGGEDVTGLRWPDLGATRGRVPSQALVEALPRLDGLSVLSCDRGDATALPVEAVHAVLSAARRSGDLVVVDLPRSFDDASREVLALCDVGLLVVPAELRAVASAARVAVRASGSCPDLRVVVRGPAPAGLGADQVARSLGLPLAGEVRAETGLDAALERGQAPGRRRGPLAGLCRALLEDLLPAPQDRAA